MFLINLLQHMYVRVQEGERRGRGKGEREKERGTENRMERAEEVWAC